MSCTDIHEIWKYNEGLMTIIRTVVDPHESGIGGWGDKGEKKDKIHAIYCSTMQSRTKPHRENAANNLTLFRCYVNLVQLSATLMLARIMENGSVGFGCSQRAIILPYVII